jgi:hypothetical protein
LTADQRDRYVELAVFGEDVAIPGPVLTRYWKATGDWSEFQTRRFCQRLAELALVSGYSHDPEQIVVHDVIREDYAKPSLKKYKPTAARNEGKKVFSGLL